MGNLLDVRIGTLVNASSGIKQYIDKIKGYGFESYSITFGDSVDESKIDVNAAEAVEASSSTGAVISSVSCFGNPLAYDEAAEKTRQGLVTLIKNASKFGCNIVTGFSGRVPNCPIPDSYPRFLEVFKPLVKLAEDNGVKIAFENCDMGGRWESGSWNIAQTPVVWDWMFNEIPSDSLGLQWEPCHQMVKLIDPIPQLRKYVKKVYNVHGKDATIMWDVVREHGVYGSHCFAYHRTPGFGDTNWADVITILRLNGYVGSIDIEGWHDPVYNRELEMTSQVYGLNYLKGCRGGAEQLPNP